MRDQPAPAIMILGPALNARGGIASVMRLWQEAGFGGQRPVRYLPTYADGSALTKLTTFLGALLRFCLLLARGRVAAVHAHSASNASFRRKSLLLALARLAGKPYIFHLHGGAFDRYHADASALERAWIDRCVRGARVVFVLSESWADWLRTHIGHPDVRVLPNPVLPVVLPDDVPREPHTLLFLGRLEDAKGVFVLIDALARLAGVRPGLRAILAGEGDLAGVRAAAAAAGVAERIELPGWVTGEAKACLLARAGIFVLPSRFEGVPMALLEAQAAGLPVVASRVGGIPQVVTDGFNGMLAAPDDVASLVTALKPLLADPALAQRMGEAGRGGGGGAGGGGGGPPRGGGAGRRPG
ncbi:glycosyltransferase family 4 protein, partial [Zoogloea sp.]|uniref:glycosyltransferase family 4 protein n=1 Tax=Zoogloea sp. TaxID=49181 RepID=UPI0035ADFC1F